MNPKQYKQTHTIKALKQISENQQKEKNLSSQSGGNTHLHTRKPLTSHQKPRTPEKSKATSLK